jgi:hypothetical protein
VKSKTLLISAIFLAALCVGSCTPAAPEIRVFRQNHRLVVDTPWTFWRWVGLQRPHLCIHGIEVFDDRQVVWNFRASGDNMAPCVDVHLPIPLGVPLEGIGAPLPLHLKAGKTYGLYLDEVNRVDFVAFSDQNPKNITDYRTFFEAPCDSRLGKYSKHCQ